MGQTNTVRFHWVASPVVVVANFAVVKVLDDGFLGGCVGINEGGHVWESLFFIKIVMWVGCGVGVLKVEGMPVAGTRKQGEE